MSQEDQDQKEEFCSPCLIAPAIFAVAGGGVAATSTAVDRQKHRKLKKIMFVVGISIAVLAILYSAYILLTNKKSSGGLAVCSQ